MESKGRTRIAVVGSGLAGLTTAWLLATDPKRRFDVEVYESQSSPSLDAASVTVASDPSGQTERIDVPMRAFSEGYYPRLKALYDFLGVEYQAQPFVFKFSRYRKARPRSPTDTETYFTHASNFHRGLPTQPESVSAIEHSLRCLFLLFSLIWFNICCFLIPTVPDEALSDYLQRTWLPRAFVHGYLLPLISAIATASHEDLLQMPASDVVNYKRAITFGKQFVVTNGVKEVQDKLTQGLKINFCHHVTKVESMSGSVRVCWHRADGSLGALAEEAIFDRVVLAIPPNAAQAIYQPLSDQMRRIPTRSVVTVVHKRPETSMKFRAPRSDPTEAFSKGQTIHLRTLEGDITRTEAGHVHHSGTLVTTCPLADIPPEDIIQTTTFTRVMRTLQSQKIVNDLLYRTAPASVDEKKPQWSDGDDGVYIVGSWCWDGMVLLEGCVVSAIDVASKLGVQTPWVKPYR